MGCDGAKIGSATSGSVEVEPPCNPGHCTTVATADKAGDEDLPFEFNYSTSVNGPWHFVTNRPAWMKIDKANKRIYGTPTGGTVTYNLKISVFDGTETEVLGPFNLSVRGDPLAQHSWHLSNTGQNSYSTGGGAPGEDVRITGALAKGVTGSGVKVAVSDTGVEILHEDLSSNVDASTSRDYNLASPYLGDPTPPGSDPEEAHGTAVAGIIGAVGWNNLGSRGVAPEVLLSGFNFLGAPSTTAKLIHQANGPFDIFNYSWGYPSCTVTDMNSSFLSQLRWGVTNLRAGKGAIYVKSAGNDYIGDLAECYPISSGRYRFYGNANFDGENNEPSFIIVGALNANGERASYSSPGSSLWISAPGGEFGTTKPAIIAPDLSGCTKGISSSTSTENAFNKGQIAANSACNYTNIMNGTSSAAPVTSGVVALMLDANPNLGWRDVKDILARTATAIRYNTSNVTPPRYGMLPFGYIYQLGWITNAAGFKFHNWYGFGRVNAEAAVAAASTHTNLPAWKNTLQTSTGKSYYQSGSINASIPDSSTSGKTVTLATLHNYVIESVQVRLNVTHLNVADLAVELDSPSGSRSLLTTHNSGIFDVNFADTILATNAFYGESSKGTWTLKLIDSKTSNSGTLNSWGIMIYGHINPDRSDTTAPNAVTALTMAATSTSTTTAPTATWAASSSSDVMRYEVSVGTTLGAEDVFGWESVGAATVAAPSGLTLTVGNTYYLNVRAIDSSENVSAASSASWQVQ